MDSMRPHVVVHNVASMDGRLTLAPGVDLMAGDERWTAMTADLPDPYAWARTTHDPQVFLEGSGSFLNPVGAAGSPSSTERAWWTCSSPSGRTRRGRAGTVWC